MKLHKNSVLRRCAAMLLAVLMCVSLFNLTAFATGSVSCNHPNGYIVDPQDGKSQPYFYCEACNTRCYQIDGGVHKVHENTEPATCTEGGSTTSYCEQCGYNVVVTTTPALGHDYGDWKVVKDPSYTEPGEKQQVCSRDSSHIHTEEIPKLTCEHKNTSEEVKDPNCTEGGYKRVVCEGCGQEISNKLFDALGHNFQFDKVITTPTCTASGKAQYQCERCNATEARDIPATGHVCPDQISWDENQHWSECKVCHEVIGEKKAHEWTEVYRKPAACTEDGEIKLDCKVYGCNASKVEAIPATGHAWDWEHGEVTKPATVYEYGQVTYTCKNDPKHTITDLIPMLSNQCKHEKGNKVEDLMTTQPTCTEDGLEYYICVDCGEVLDTKVIPALGHEWGPWIDTGDSLKHFQYCKRNNCEYYSTPVTGVHENWETFTKDPTCTENGYTEKKCVDCGYSETTVIPATHEWGKWEPEGAKDHQKECAKCGSHINSDHIYDAGEAVTVGGRNGTKYTCTECGYSYFEPYTVVTWRNYDGTLLFTADYKPANVPAADQYTTLSGNQNPSHPENATYTYAFSGWSAADTDSDGNVTYTAQYTSTAKPVNPPVIIIPSNPSTATPTPTPEPDEDIEDPDVPLGPNPGEPTPTPDSDEDIEDPDVPLGPNPGEPTPTPDPDEDIEDPDVPLGPNPGEPTPTPDPDEDIEDPDVPLGPGPVDPDAKPTPAPGTKPTPKPADPSAPDDGEEIPDENVPLSNTPKTGDDNNVWMTLALVSAAGLVFLGFSRKRKGENVR